MFPLATPPLGILSLAAYLRTKLDLDIRLVNQRVEDLSDDRLVREIVSFEPDAVGLGALTPFGYLLPSLTRNIRDACPHALIVLGGPHASASREAALRATTADALVVGEGELAFERILQTHFDGGSFGQIPGLIWREPGGEVVTNPGAMPPIEDLDSLPFPAYDLIDVTRYWRVQSQSPVPNRHYVAVSSSRGCPYQCQWCHNLFGKRFRAQSAERVVDEIAHYVKTYGMNDIEFVDDIFNLDRQRVHDFCSLVCKRDLKIKIAFGNALRGDILGEDDVDALAAAGTYFCSLALESGSPRIQQLMGKGLNIPRFLAGVSLAAARGVFTNGALMFGFPTETAEEMQMTIDVAAKSKLHTASIFTVTPFPNTPLYEWAKEHRPEKLKGLRYDEADFNGIHANLSDVPDDVLFHYQRKAHRQFFLNPRRLARILRDSPDRAMIRYAPIFIYRCMKGLVPGLT